MLNLESILCPVCPYGFQILNCAYQALTAIFVSIYLLQIYKVWLKAMRGPRMASQLVQWL